MKLEKAYHTTDAITTAQKFVADRSPRHSHLATSGTKHNLYQGVGNLFA